MLCNKELLNDGENGKELTVIYINSNKNLHWHGHTKTHITIHTSIPIR